MKNSLAKLMSFGVLALAGGALFTGCGSSNPEPTQATADSIPSALPGEICVVSEEELGSMGEPVEHRHQNHTILFCCKACLPEFNKNSEKYLAALKSGEPAGSAMP